MSFNGSGTFVINSSGQPVVTNTVISSTAFNALTADLGTGLSTTITKDGQTTTTAKIPFAFGLSAAAASNFPAGTVAAPGLYLSTDTGTGLYRIGANNDGFAVSGAKVLDIASTGLGITGTLSATGLTLDSSQNLGIGVTPTAKLHVKSTANDAANGLRLEYNSGTPYYGRVRMVGNDMWIDADTGNTGGVMKFTTAGTATAMMTISTTGLAVNGTLSATTGAAVGGATAGAGGIAFPATAVAVANANTLDDYEEGTWTPSQGSGLTVVGAFSSSGTYVKIGNQVTVQAVLTGATSIACSNGGQIFTGLPFSMSGIAIGSESDNTNTSGHTVFCFTTLCYNNYAAIAAVTSIYVSVTYIV